MARHHDHDDGRARPALDYFVAPNLSVGGQRGSNASVDKAWHHHARRSACCRASVTTSRCRPPPSIWPRVGLGYIHTSYDTAAPAQTTSGYTRPLEVFVPLVFQPVPHFFIGGGPGLRPISSRSVEGVDTIKSTRHRPDVDDRRLLRRHVDRARTNALHDDVSRPAGRDEKQEQAARPRRRAAATTTAAPAASEQRPIGSTGRQGAAAIAWTMPAATRAPAARARGSRPVLMAAAPSGGGHAVRGQHRQQQRVAERAAGGELRAARRLRRDAGEVRAAIQLAVEIARRRARAPRPARTRSRPPIRPSASARRRRRPCRGSRARTRGCRRSRARRRALRAERVVEPPRQPRVREADGSTTRSPCPSRGARRRACSCRCARAGRGSRSGAPRTPRTGAPSDRAARARSTPVTAACRPIEPATAATSGGQVSPGYVSMRPVGERSSRSASAAVSRSLSAAYGVSGSTARSIPSARLM